MLDHGISFVLHKEASIALVRVSVYDAKYGSVLLEKIVKGFNTDEEGQWQPQQTQHQS